MMFDYQLNHLIDDYIKCSYILRSQKNVKQLTTLDLTDFSIFWNSRFSNPKWVNFVNLCGHIRIYKLYELISDCLWIHKKDVCCNLQAIENLIINGLYLIGIDEI